MKQQPNTKYGAESHRLGQEFDSIKQQIRYGEDYLYSGSLYIGESS